ncbi:MAG: putative oxidoreductase [Myxococcales bacterium]|nr:putative oxidoreductase [Myxococcales bacterium]
MFYFRLSMEIEHVPVVIVTGGTRGIGRAIAERFMASGAQLIVCARKPPERPLRFEGAGRAGRDRAPEALFVVADVREPADIERVVATAKERFGRLDVLVNNAGGSPPAVAATASPRFSTAIVTLNLLAPLHFAQRANAVMQEQASGGVIVNVASVSGLRPSPGTAAYGAAKAGLINLTQSLAVEWAPKVRLNCVAPGPIRTEITELHLGDAAAQAKVAATIPLGRLGEPADVADACFWLASPASRFVSGACLVLHGGGEMPAFLTAVHAAD